MKRGEGGRRGDRIRRRRGRRGGEGGRSGRGREEDGERETKRGRTKGDFDLIFLFSLLRG